MSHEQMPNSAVAVEQSSSNSDDCEPYTDSPNSTPPPSFREIDFQNLHISLKEFGEGLQAAARAVFPNETASRYSKVTVLMLSWDDEDPNLPVSIEISRLYNVFNKVYHFEVEMWKIPDRDSHFAVNQKIGNFVSPAEDDKEHLKIVYYAGHGRLTKNRTLAWTSWRNRDKTRPPSLIWSGIQVLLEQAQSDTLILLDCCASGTANTGEGNGVSELLSACAYNSTANGVGPYSFTNALVIELKELSKRPSFSVGELYSNIYRRIQNRMPEDGRERHPPPIHLALTQENLFPRSIQLSVCRVPGDLNAKPLNNFLEFNSSLDHNIDRGEAVSSLARAYSHSTSHSGYHMRDSEMSSCDAKVPRLTFAVRLKDTLRASELSEDLFKEWLRTIPAVVEEVKVEAGFDSFSSLLIVSLPIAMSLYIPRDPAIICLGPVTSFNQVSHPTTTGDPKLEMGSPNQSQQCVIDDPLSSIEHSMATKQPKPEIVHAVPTLTPDMSQSVAGNDEAAHMQPETVLNAVVDEVPPQTTSTEPSVIPMISSLALTTDKMTADDQLELARQLKTELSRELELTKIEPKAEEPAPAEDEWSFGISKKDKKKKKDAVEEKRTLEPEPEAAVDDFGWGSFGTSKEDKKKTGKGVVEESENSKEPDPELETPVEDNGWGSFVIKKDKKKKRAVEGPPKAREPTPGSHLKPDNDHFDFGLGTKKDKKVEKKRATRDAPKSKEPIRESDTQRDEGALAEALSGLQIMIRKK